MSRIEKSLIEVREWKEQCRIEAEKLSTELYIKKIKDSSKKIMDKYNFSLKIAKFKHISC